MSTTATPPATPESSPVQKSLATFVNAGTEFKPAVIMGRGLPTKRNDQPALYYWKEMLRVGTVHDINGRPQEITASRLDKLESNTRKRMAKGYEPYLPLGRHFDKKESRGYLVDLERRGESLYGLHQFIGPEDKTREIVARNKSSIGTVSNVVDSTGEVYDEIIDHDCVCPDPQFDGLSPFEPIDSTDILPALAASRGQPIEAVVLELDRGPSKGATKMAQTLTPQHVTKIKKLIGDSEGTETANTVTEDNGIECALGHIERMHAKPPQLKMSREQLDAAREVTGMEQLSPEEAAAALIRKAKESEAKALNLSRELKDAKEAKTAVDNKMLELSRSSTTPAPPTAAELHYASRAVASEKDKAIKSGAITPAVADQAEAKFLKKPVEFKTLTLSREVEPTDVNLRTGLANLLDFYEAVQGNTPAPKQGEDANVSQNLLALGRHLMPGQDNRGGASLAKSTEEAWEAQDKAMKERELAHAK